MKEKGDGVRFGFFMVEGLTPGDVIVLQLDRGDPKCAGISPQIFFSYDQKVWGLTDTGVPEILEGRDFKVFFRRLPQEGNFLNK